MIETKESLITDNNFAETKDSLIKENNCNETSASGSVSREYALSRTEMLLGKEALKKLRGSRVAVFGIGGVGGFAVEALARSGIGHLDIIDKDVVDGSNLNRQIIALRSTIGRNKVDVMEERIRDIDPDITVNKHAVFYLPETKDEFDFSVYNYVVDAIDTVTGKIQLILQAKEAGVPVISSMGTGNKLDPTSLEVADIYDTSICPLAKVMRKELRKRGVDSLKVVYSKEEPMKPGSEGTSMICSEDPIRKADDQERKPRTKQTPGSISFVPSVAGLIIAGEVIKDLISVNCRHSCSG